MRYEIEDIKSQAKDKLEENREFLEFLKECDSEDPGKIDDLFYIISDDVSSGIDCTNCGQCCKDHKPIFSDNDQQRLANRLGITIKELKDDYLEYNEWGFTEPKWQLRQTPCSFFSNNKCTVYECRPGGCRAYPNLNWPSFNRTPKIILESFTCPIVFYVIEELKKELDFLPENGSWED